MWYKKYKSILGQYKDAEGTKYSVSKCHRVTAPDGRKNAELGYTEFENMEECLTSWGLSQVSEPALTKLSKNALTKFLHKV